VALHDEHLNLFPSTWNQNFCSCLGTNGGDDVSKEIVRLENASVTYRVRHANSRSLKEVAIKSITTKKGDVEITSAQ
jgi:hypothetical protein